MNYEVYNFHQLCRELARKTGLLPSAYEVGYTRQEVINELRGYDTPTQSVGVDLGPLESKIEAVQSRVEYHIQIHKNDIHKLEQELDYNLRAVIDQRHYQALKAIDTTTAKIKEEIESDILYEIAKIQEKKVVHTIELKTPEGVVKKPEGRCHKDFGELLALLATKQKVMVIGPAGSGKTQAAIEAARMLDVPFFFNGAIDSEYKLMGFIDAQGRIVNTAFRTAFTNGGLYLWDEFDASLPPALLAFNAATGNDMCDFPGEGVVKAHPNFYCMAAGNTYYGADHQYVGRMKQDAAFLDRFLVLDWHYDAALERGICRDVWDDALASSWVEMVILTREQAALKGLHVVVSPRASIGGVKLLRSGVSWDTAIRVCLRKTMKPSDWEKIQEFTQPQRPKVAKSTPWPVEEIKSSPIKDPVKKYDSYDPFKPDPHTFSVKSHGKRHKKFIRDLL